MFAVCFNSQCLNRYEQVHVSCSRSLNKKRLKTALEEAARRTNATTSCLRALFDKPIRLRAFLHAVRKTNQNSCSCSPAVSVLFAVFFFFFFLIQFLFERHTKTALSCVCPPSPPHTHRHQTTQSIRPKRSKYGSVWTLPSAVHSYDLYHIHLTSFSSYNGYKLNSHLTCFQRGFIAQSVEHRTGVAEVLGSTPVGASEFFSGLYL